MNELSPSLSDDVPADRLGSWKEIAAYLSRDVSTVQRWEKREGMPVHRHVHNTLGSVYAFRTELDTWWRTRRGHLEHRQEPGTETIPVAAVRTGADASPSPTPATTDDGIERVHWPVDPNGYVTPRHLLRASLALILKGGLVACLVAPIAYLVLFGPTIEATRPAITSLAVLPLENLSGDSAQEYFADGMTEALIGRLAQIQALRIVSRTSVMTFKGSRKPLPEIARELRVDAVLEGSVQRSGDRVRIGIQLVHGPTDTHLWAHDYEREWRDILRLQADVARAVSEEIRIQVTAEERARLASAVSIDPAAYQEYLVGRYHLWRYDEENLKRAIAHFERATRIDPTYAAAFASLSHAWWARGMWGPMGLKATESTSRQAARRALELDDGLAEGYVVQADLKRLYDWDPVGAEQMVTRALALDHNNVAAHHTYALLLMALGRFPEALAHIARAEELDPLSPAIQSNFGRILYRARKFNDAIPRLERALELEPGMQRGVYGRLGDVYDQLGQYERALEAYQHASNQNPADQAYQARLARIFARMGKVSKAKRLLESLESGPGFPLYAAAAAYATLGNHDQAFRLLFRMMDREYAGSHYETVDPLFDRLHSDPRWAELLRRINFPPEVRNQ